MSSHDEVVLTAHPQAATLQSVASCLVVVTLLPLGLSALMYLLLLLMSMATSACAWSTCDNVHPQPQAAVKLEDNMASKPPPAWCACVPFLVTSSLSIACVSALCWAPDALLLVATPILAALILTPSPYHPNPCPLPT